MLYNLGIFLLVSLILIWVLKRFYCEPMQEGFSQTSPYVLKQNNSIYDSFYLDYYDEYQSSDSYSIQDSDTIRTSTKITDNSSILDVGCGTGHLLQKLEQHDVHAFGLDISPTMVEHTKLKVKHSEVQCGNVTSDPMRYENDSFSHICCTHFTLYEIQDKNTFFKHCYFWLRKGGYLIVHIVNPELYKKAAPSIDLSSVSSKIQKTTISETTYDYERKINPSSSNKDECIVTETFTDSINGNVRHNEMTMYMESKRDLLKMAQDTGFEFVEEKTYINDLYDENQFLVILVKPLCGKE
jgi:SAM-dependent methyltransferase